MYYTKNLTPTNGFDFNNLDNARQNNYAWSVSELDDYIYVGTGRNIAYLALKSYVGNLQIPMSISPLTVDMSAEIWRYKKDGSLPWNRVFKTDATDKTNGFRFMINHSPLNADPYLYAAGLGEDVKIFKSTNGQIWYPLESSTLKGTSSRTMISYRGKLYIATVDDLSSTANSYLYSSVDPEFYPWQLLTDSSDPNYIYDKNPQGSITNMAIFNNKLYVATSSPDGVQVWRTNKAEPEINDWTLIVDKGFGDSSNKMCLSIGVFKDYLYVSGVKSLPLAWAIPQGSDLIRISKNDNWDLVVGGDPITPSTPSKGVRNKSLSRLGSGFNNPFNVYLWQIQEYNNKLLISTFDDASNMKVILDTLLLNKTLLENTIDPKIVSTLIEIYTNIVKLLSKIKYPFGFDLYESSDGINFTPVFLDGINNGYNYGGRILFVDNKKDLYLGTANPFQGCELYAVKPSLGYNDYINNFKPFYDFRKEGDELHKLINMINMILPQIFSE